VSVSPRLRHEDPRRPSAPPAASGSGDSWRDSSGDNGIGWIGQKVFLPPGVPVEVDFITVGGFDSFCGRDGQPTTSRWRPVIDWFFAASAQQAQTTTDAYWQAWLAAGVPRRHPPKQTRSIALFKRALLATALHIDGKTGSVIAGFPQRRVPLRLGARRRLRPP